MDEKYQLGDHEFENIHELQTLIEKYDHLKTFLLTVRIATIVYRNGLIPKFVREGINRIDGRSKGGQKPKERSMIKQAMIKSLPKIEKKDAFSLWLYFAKNHYGFQKALRVEEHNIFFQIDIKGIDKETIPIKEAAKRGKLFQMFLNEDSTMKGIKLPTFRQYFSELFPKRLKKNMSK
ncbi:MAG: hypothetical protein MUP41_06095 [Desulfobacterales bacterium]|nr:hypothetical protein [Desulfobacterales bacterium]